MRKILLYLNTNFHVETLLSIYASIQNLSYEPFILFGGNDILNFKGLCNKYNLNLLNEKDINTIDLNNFDCNIIITGYHRYDPKEISFNSIKNKFFPPGNVDILKLFFNKKTIILYHQADYKEYYEYQSQFFKNSSGLSVTSFSQKYNLNYIYQTDNIITKSLKLKKHLSNDEIKLIIPTRFNKNNQFYIYIDEILKYENLLKKHININFIGSSLNAEKDAIKKIKSFLNLNLKNISITIDFDLEEVGFYEKVKNSDFIFNLRMHPTYFCERFCSGVNHIISFEKPNFNYFLLSSIYNIPGYIYGSYVNFGNLFYKKINNLNNEEYNLMCNSFDILKNNMYNHNNLILNKIISDL